MISDYFQENSRFLLIPRFYFIFYRYSGLLFRGALLCDLATMMRWCWKGMGFFSLGGSGCLFGFSVSLHVWGWSSFVDVPVQSWRTFCFRFFGSRVSFYMSVPSLVWRRYVQYSPLPKRTQMHTDFRVPRRSSANNRSFFFYFHHNHGRAKRRTNADHI